MMMIILVFLSPVGVFISSAVCSDDDDIRIADLLLVKNTIGRQTNRTNKTKYIRHDLTRDIAFHRFRIKS